MSPNLRLTIRMFAGGDIRKARAIELSLDNYRGVSRRSIAREVGLPHTTVLGLVGRFRSQLAKACRTAGIAPRDLLMTAPPASMRSTPGTAHAVD